jgi:hypothetical protein
MSNPEIDRIRSDMKRCRERIAEITQGKRGVRTGAWQEVEGMPGAGLAYGNQLLAQETALQRLQAEYVQAMLPVWSPAAIIERMEAPPPAPQVVERAPTPAEIRAGVRQFLAAIPDWTPLKNVKELVS